MSYSHPEHLFNEFNDQDFVLVTRTVNSPEAALTWLREYTGADYEEIDIGEAPIWLKRGPVPEEYAGYYENSEDFYLPADEGIDDPETVAYWFTEV